MDKNVEKEKQKEAAEYIEKIRKEAEDLNNKRSNKIK
jgi:hypothetical protein